MYHLRLLSTLCLLFTGNMADAAVIYVNQFASGNNTGLDWVNAYTDLQSALAAAQAGDEIWVVSGDYYPTEGTDRNTTFLVPTGVALYGGFSGTETQRDERDWIAAPTFLNGNIGDPSEFSDNAYSIITVNDPDTANVIDGFRILNGLADNLLPEVPTYDAGRRGAGIFIATSGEGAVADYQLIIRNCEFTGNEAEYGGAIYGNSRNNSHIALQVFNCTFERNRANFGAAYASERGNAGESGVVFQGCRFLRNYSEIGGTIYLVVEGKEEGQLLVQDCEFRENEHRMVEVYPPDFDIPFHFIIRRSVFADNKSEEGSRAAIRFRARRESDFLMDSVLFNNNDYPRLLSLTGAKEARIINSTFESNQASIMEAFLEQGMHINGCTLEDNETDLLIRSPYIGISMSTFSHNAAAGTLLRLEPSSGVSDPTHLKMEDCTFSSNQVGGLWYSWLDTSLLNKVYVFDDQDAGQSVIRFSGKSAVIYNSLFVRRSRYTGKAAIYCIGESELDFVNCTFFNFLDGQTGVVLNAQGQSENASLVGFKNSILWDDRKEDHPIFLLEHTRVEISHSLISTGGCENSFTEINPAGGTSEVICDTAGFFGRYPLFIDTSANLDLRLLACSPLINRGEDAFLPAGFSEDLSGQPRVFADTIDIGAFELQGVANQLTVEAEVIPTSIPEAADGSISITAVKGGIPDYTYDWSLGNGGPLLNELQEGIYSITITDQLGCSSEFVFEVGTLNAVVDPAMEWGVRLWPNPVGKAENSKLLIGAYPANLNRVRLYSAQGRLVWQQAIEKVAEVELPLDLQSGWYLLQITDRAGRHGYLKWIVQ